MTKWLSSETAGVRSIPHVIGYEFYDHKVNEASITPVEYRNADGLDPSFLPKSTKDGEGLGSRALTLYTIRCCGARLIKKDLRC
jgi:hypothetical protein